MNFTVTSSSPGNLATRVSVTFFLSSTEGVLGFSEGFSALGCSEGVVCGLSSGFGCSGVTCGFSSTLGSSFLTSATTVVTSSTSLSSIFVAFFSNKVLVILYLSPAFISLSVISNFLSSSLETLVELSSLTSLPRIRSTLVTIYQLRP